MTQFRPATDESDSPVSGPSSLTASSELKFGSSGEGASDRDLWGMCACALSKKWDPSPTRRVLLTRTTSTRFLFRALRKYLHFTVRVYVCACVSAWNTSLVADSASVIPNKDARLMPPGDLSPFGCQSVVLVRDHCCRYALRKLYYHNLRKH